MLEPRTLRNCHGLKAASWEPMSSSLECRVCRVCLGSNCSYMNWDGTTFRNLSRKMAVGEELVKQHCWGCPCAVRFAMSHVCAFAEGQPVAHPLLPLCAMQMEAPAHWFLRSTQPCHVVDGWH